jgi:hypothetical protein
MLLMGRRDMFWTSARGRGVAPQVELVAQRACLRRFAGAVAP